MNEKAKMNFVTIKLVSGETLLATLAEYTDDFTWIWHPMLVKTIPYIRDGKITENVSLCPWSNFTDDYSFQINNADIIFIKDLHEIYISPYLTAVEDSLKTDEVSDDVPDVFKNKIVISGNETIN